MSIPRCTPCGVSLKPLTSNGEQFGRIPGACYANPDISVDVLLSILEHLLAAFDDFAGGDWLVLCKIGEGCFGEAVEQQQHRVKDEVGFQMVVVDMV